MARIDITLYEELPGAGLLGRHREHDSRSWDYAVEAGAEPAQAPPPVLWARHSPILDQGNLPAQGIILRGPDGQPIRALGSCTGNAMTGWLGCEPHCASAADAATYNENFAIGLYRVATGLDSIPGQWPPDDTGSSGLAVAKAAKKAQLISGYGWAFTTWGMIHALRTSSVIVGVPWFRSMDHPDADGFLTVDPGTELRGGHEFLIRGWTPASGGREAYFTADNSWGPGFADHGSMYLPQSGWEILRNQQADVTVPRL